MKQHFLAGSFIIFIVACFTGCSNPVILKFNLLKGSKLDYVADVDMHMTENVMGQTVNVRNKIALGYIFEVVNDSAGWKTINSTIDKISMNIDAGGNNIAFDTDNPNADTTGPAGMMLKMFGAMKGGQFTYTMDEKGHVGNVYGMKEMVERMMSKLNVPNAEMMMQNVSNSFNEKSFKENIEQSFAAYPDKPVKPGDTWVRTMNINSSGLPVKYENTYTLSSVSGNIATIKVSSKLSSDANSGDGPTKNLSGTMAGITTYDIPSGIPLNSNMDMIMNMKVTAQGQEIPVNMNMKMTVTGKKL